MTILLALALLALIGFVVYLLIQDRAYWRSQHQDLQKEARHREKHLFDELLLSKSVRPISAPRTQNTAAERVERKDAISEEDYLTARDRLREYSEAGHLSASDEARLLMQLQSGEITQAELDRELWMRNRATFQGSEMEI